MGSGAAPPEGEGQVQVFSAEFRQMLWDLLSAKKEKQAVKVAESKAQGAMLLLKLKQAVRRQLWQRLAWRLGTEGDATVL